MSDLFTSGVDLSQIKIQVACIDDSVDRTQYSSMKECLTCGTALGKTGAKKFFCYFCYRAICAGCSPVEIPHPETRKPQKMCHPCYVHYIKLQVLQVGEEYVKFRLIKEIEIKARLIEERRQLETEYNELEKRSKVKKDENAQKIREKKDELEKEKQKFAECCKEHKEVEAELNSQEQTAKPMPDTQHRDNGCMKCEIF